MNAILTSHAIERVEERLSLRRDSLQRLADAALDCGIRHDETRGKLRRYMDRLYLSQGSANNNRIHGSHVFIFENRVLITVHLLPHEFSAVVAKLKARKSNA